MSYVSVIIIDNRSHILESAEKKIKNNNQHTYGLFINLMVDEHMTDLYQSHY